MNKQRFLKFRTPMTGQSMVAYLVVSGVVVAALFGGEPSVIEALLSAFQNRYSHHVMSYQLP